MGIRKAKLWLSFALILILVFALTGQAASGDNGKPQRYIVTFQSGTPVNEEALKRLEHRFGGEHHDVTLINGAVVIVPPSARVELEGIPGATVEEDGVVSIVGIDSGDPEVAAAWGVDRIDAEKAWPTTTGIGVKVGIIDTGIDRTHPDLPSIAGGRDFVNSDNDPSDDNGHGTHVAGTIAAQKNGNGVVGVAPGVKLYAYKVLNASGSGYWSDLILALNQAVADGMQVVNMSMGGSSAPTALKTACDNAYAAGVLLVAAAGNGGGVIYPAKYASVIAVSATDKSDKRAFFSSSGAEVELAAPGVNIKSTYLGGGYATLSGTSMATPHVTGTAALVFASGRATTAGGVRTILQRTADDFGAAGRDKFYGYGLVDAQEAATGVQTLP